MTGGEWKRAGEEDLDLAEMEHRGNAILRT